MLYKRNDYLQKTYLNRAKVTNDKHLARQKGNRRRVKSLKHYTLCGIHGKHNEPMVQSFSQ